ncbi:MULTISPECIES: diaminopimelate decarboxylase [unclassified Pseudomonas]|uniref:diaminopimelate decarboxylase n=1 Tax=unclassified Pseudomonas TaxID=196821 RepID=UPI000BA431AE|nr:MULTISPECIES: diaminopimelate decarboxylase [unclassified Pseudomonas]
MNVINEPWWQRESLAYRNGRLNFCQRDVADLATAFKEPLFLYEAQRPAQKLQSLERALQRRAIPYRLYYAMKANRFPPLLCHLRESGEYGLDVCSPEELYAALACGYRPEQISYTAHGMAQSDARLLAAFPQVAVNCDTMSALRCLGRLGRGREIGLRINPGIGIGYADSEKLSYAGQRTTKFGIYQEQFDEALALAHEYGLKVIRLHCHAGCGYLDSQLDSFENVLEALACFFEKLPELQEVNLGGGLGLPHRADECALDLERWASLIQKHIASRGVRVLLEPGDFIVKDAGMLVLRVNYLETKRDTLFAGLDGGFNLAIEPAFYDMPCEPAPCVLRPGEPQRMTLAGNINEALDIWAADVRLSPLEEGDFVALLNAGGYAASMSSNHCMRGSYRELLLC